MDCQVISTANAGVIVSIGDFRFSVDALHKEKVPFFSTLDEKMVSRVLEWNRAKPWDLMLFTHHHRDHFSPELAAAACKETPSMLVFDPCGLENYPSALKEINAQLVSRNVQISAISLPHAVPCLEEGLENYGFLVCVDGINLLFLGDSCFDIEKINGLLTDSIDIAFLNFTWLTGRRGRELLSSVIRPSHIVVFHLPFEQDDNASVSYRRTAEECRSRFMPSEDIRLMMDFGQKETITIQPYSKEVKHV